MYKNDTNDEINVSKLLHTLWKNGLLILLAALFTAVVTIALTFFLITPKYEATASFYVNNSSFTLGSANFSISSSELTASNSLVNTYIYILQSRTTLEDVISKAGLPYNYEELSDMLTTKAVQSTAAFEVTVRSKTPQESELIANTIAELLPERIAEIVDGSSVRIIDYAIVPAHRSSPNYVENTVIGFLAGMIISMGFISSKFMKEEQNDDFIHSASELKALYPKYHVLTLIPDMRYSDKKEYYYSSYYGGTEEKKKK